MVGRGSGRKDPRGSVEDFVGDLHARPPEFFNVDPNQTPVIKAQRLQILKRQARKWQGVTLAFELGILETDGF
jgi:hypothetical protein